MMRIVFDITRSMHAVSSTPDGVGRVEKAFIVALLRAPLDWRVIFVSRSAFGFMEVPLGRVLYIINRQENIKNDLTRFSRECSRVLRKLYSLGRLVRIKSDDIYIEANASRDLSRDGRFSRMRNKIHFRYLSFCHDLIPLKFPYWDTQNGFVAQYAAGLSLVADSDGVICNSLNTAQDFKEYCARINKACPKLFIVPLGCDVKQFPVKPENYQLPTQGFVLCVGVVAGRKNYDLLLHLWSEFSSNKGMNELGLVIIGRKGDFAEQVIRRLDADVTIACNVTYLEHVPEGQLSWFYQNCLFTVHPSIYEGWGLPVSESLARGKVCLASSTPSMLEAGQDLAIHIHPHDFLQWKEKIMELVLHPDRRVMLENKIIAQYNHRTWGAVGDDFLDVVKVFRR